MAMDTLELTVDGVRFKLWRDKDGDIRLIIDRNEAVILSVSTAYVIGVALINMAEKEEDDGSSSH